MSSIDWGTGRVDYTLVNGECVCKFFEADGVVWYDASKGIVVDGWKKALDPYDGTDGLRGLLEVKAIA